MSTITVTLKDEAAQQVVTSMARSYALLCIHSRLTQPRGTVDAPWFRWKDRSGKGMVAAHREWMRRVDRERAAYRRSLESIRSPLPAVPAIEWRPFKAPDGRVYPVMYSATRAHEAATLWARDFWERCSQEEIAA